VASAPGINKLLAHLPTKARDRLMAARNLQKVGLIRYSRGKLVILDRRSLGAASRQCYWAVTKEFYLLFV
jgi:hypothetical protein